MNTLDFAHDFVSVLEEKKAEKLILLDIRAISSFADYFIICNGTSDRMLTALAEAVREHSKQEYDLPVSIEGEPRDGWLVVDLGSLVIHLFSPDQRNYYQLEKLWERGKRLVSLQ